MNGHKLGVYPSFTFHFRAFSCSSVTYLTMEEVKEPNQEGLPPLPLKQIASPLMSGDLISEKEPTESLNVDKPKISPAKRRRSTVNKDAATIKLVTCFPNIPESIEETFDCTSD